MGNGHRICILNDVIFANRECRQDGQMTPEVVFLYEVGRQDTKYRPGERRQPRGIVTATISGAPGVCHHSPGL